jgi:hypothetical protein
MTSLLALVLAALPALRQEPAPAAPAGLDVDVAVGGAVAAALAPEGARAEIGEVRVPPGRGCAPSRAEALRPVTASGDVPLRLAGVDPDGLPCEIFGWARVRVLGGGLLLSRPVLPGDPLEGAVRPAEVEILAGRAPLSSLPRGARAGRALPVGTPLLASDVRLGPLPGEPIGVMVRTGALELSLTGRALACGRGRACALLPGGRRVQGRLEGDHLLVEVP